MAALGIGTFVGVPLCLADGTVWGTLCALDPAPAAASEEAVQTLQVLARFVATDLDRQAAAARLREGEARLRESEERFRGAFEHAAIGMALVAPDGRFLRVNRALGRIVGYGQDELLGRSFQEITHPADLDADLAQVRRLLAGEIAAYELEKRYLRADGGVAWVLLSVSLVRDDAGEPLHFIAQMQDISARKAAEAALAAERDQLQALLDTAPDLIYVKDAHGRFVRVNPALARQFGCDDPQALVGKSDFDVYPEELARGFAADERRILETGQPLVNRLERQSAEGEPERWTLTSKVPLFADGRAIGLVGISRDATAMKRAEDSLRAAKEAAEEASRLKSAFLSTMSHELRTPLTAIMGYAGVLLEGLNGPLAPEQEADVACIARGAERLLGLVNDVLDLSKIEAGGLALRREPVDLGLLLAQVRSEVAPLAAAKGLAVEAAGAAGVVVEADPQRLHQILLNLVGNAVKFTEAGSVRVAVEPGAEGVAIAVADTGIGIAPEDLPRVFDEFRQVDGSTTRRYGGTGLGLAIARRLVEAHGGAIAAASEVGVGSTFTVTLPWRRAVPAGPVAPTAAAGPIAHGDERLQDGPPVVALPGAVARTAA